jgi:hypothetical protein
MTAVRIESDGIDLFVVRDGKRIAKRGYPRTPQAGTWISLEPDWSVFDGSEEGVIIFEHNGARVH